MHILKYEAITDSSFFDSLPSMVVSIRVVGVALFIVYVDFFFVSSTHLPAVFFVTPILASSDRLSAQHVWM